MGVSHLPEEADGIGPITDTTASSFRRQGGEVPGGAAADATGVAQGTPKKTGLLAIEPEQLIRFLCLFQLAAPHIKGQPLEAIRHLPLLHRDLHIDLSARIDSES